MKNLSKILWGMVLIVLGIVIGLNSLEITNIDIFFEGWWTLFIIIPCFIGLFDSSESRFGNMIGIIIGFALLLASRDILSFSLLGKIWFPFILIVIGISLIFHNSIKKNIADKVKIGKENGLESIVATFSDEKISKEKEKFDGANIDAIFGGITLDLSQAVLKEETIISSSAIFGGITIIVPKDVNVKIKPTSIFGGTSNRMSNKEENKKTVYIESFCLFGGLEIK
ncbi:MAG: cell wall-active antibiotics response protein [Bacilli bacterium]|nr:cell wall-active antibiotics response protein [Bacilli bacterium]